MLAFRKITGAVGALFVVVGLVETASAQFAPPPVAPRVSHIGLQPYLRIPIGSRAEAAALKADQDAALLTSQPKKKKALKRR